MIARPRREGSTTAMPTEPITVEALQARLVDAAGLGADGDRLVVVDLDGPGPDVPPLLHSGVPLVVVGLADVAAPRMHPAAACCDVVLHPDDSTGLAAIGAAVASNPIAATALCLLLRGAEGRSPDEGLLLESATYSALQAGPEFARWRGAHPPRSRGAGGPPVALERRDGRLDVVLARPHLRNALSTAMRDELASALRLAALDDSITEVHLRGEGPSFCSGGDLDEFGSFADPASAHLVRLQQSVGRAIAAVADRVIAHLHGACMGSGIELPAFAGRVVAAPDTIIGLPEVALGLVPGAGGTVSIPARIGRHRTAQLALTGQPIGAETALAWGLVDALTD